MPKKGFSDRKTVIGKVKSIKISLLAMQKDNSALMGIEKVYANEAIKALSKITKRTIEREEEN